MLVFIPISYEHQNILQFAILTNLFGMVAELFDCIFFAVLLSKRDGIGTEYKFDWLSKRDGIGTEYKFDFQPKEMELGRNISLIGAAKGTKLGLNINSF